MDTCSRSSSEKDTIRLQQRAPAPRPQLLKRHDWSRIVDLMDKVVFDQERTAPERAMAEATA